MKIIPVVNETLFNYIKNAEYEFIDKYDNDTNNNNNFDEIKEDKNINKKNYNFNNVD